MGLPRAADGPVPADRPAAAVLPINARDTRGVPTPRLIAIGDRCRDGVVVGGGIQLIIKWVVMEN